MPKKHPAKKAKKNFDICVLEEQLEDYHKDKLLHVVDRVCRMSMTEAKGLEEVATTLLDNALRAELEDRKPLAVLARRLHDRLPRFQPPDAATTSSVGVVASITLASCLAIACETSLAKVHDEIQDSAGLCSGESSFSGANDENEHPAPPTFSPLEAPSPAPTTSTASAKPQPLSLLQRLHALQTFSACLYTQDIISEVSIHSIFDHVRYGSASWPQSAKDAAVSGICDMTKFCGKRLESLGTLKSAMPDFYSHLELLAAGTSVSDAVKANITEVLALRQNGWQVVKEERAAGAEPNMCAGHDSVVAPLPLNAAACRQGAERRTSIVSTEGTTGDAGGFDFAALLEASGIKIEAPVLTAGGKHVTTAPGGFPYITEPEEPVVKMEDMLAAVQGMDM